MKCSNHSLENATLPPAKRRKLDEDVQLELVTPALHSAAVAAGKNEYQPGAIVRIKLLNFVTYEAVEFYPGPSLNMIIGPNGSGKSTVVSAICLGLGWGPQLGRAKELAEFVHYGSEEATIEIELQRDPKRFTNNVIVCRKISRKGSKSLWFINHQPSNQARVLAMVRSFSIQVDNLCQFLPQDRVAEFADLDPIELLQSTIRAGACHEMIEQFQTLKVLRRKLHIARDEQARLNRQLSNEEAQQRLQEVDFEMVNERIKIETEVKLLKEARPLLQYCQIQSNYIEQKNRIEQAKEDLRILEATMECLLDEVDEQREFCCEVFNIFKREAEVVFMKVKGIAAVVTQLISKLQLSETLSEQLHETKFQAMKLVKETYLKKELLEILMNKTKEPQIQFDVLEHNRRARDLEFLTTELITRVRKLKSEQRKAASTCTENDRQMVSLKDKINLLHTRYGQRLERLTQLCPDASKAFHWLQKNQNRFGSTVFGPPAVECYVEDPRYADMMESLVSPDQMITFTVQSTEDFRLLQAALFGELHLDQVSISTYDTNQKFEGPPMSKTDLQSYGFEGWAKDFIIGPEVVRSMLCDQARLHQTAVLSGNLKEQQLQALKNSPIVGLVTQTQYFRLVTRREYGKTAISTRVRPITEAKYWTGQPLPDNIEKHLYQQIQLLEAEKHIYNNQINELQKKFLILRREYLATTKVIGEMKEFKRKMQVTVSAQSGLPTKIKHAQAELVSIGKIQYKLKLQYRETIKRQKKLVSELLTDVNICYKSVKDFINTKGICDNKMNIAAEEASQLFLLKKNVQEVRYLSETKEREISELEIRTRQLGFCLKKKSIETLIKRPEMVKQIKYLESITSDELNDRIDSLTVQLDVLRQDDGWIVEEYMRHQRRIQRFRNLITASKECTDTLETKIKYIRSTWEPQLDNLICHINDAFLAKFKLMGCLGVVDLYKEDDHFDRWKVEIKVKFRVKDSLSLLNSHRQSGGERAVSTIFYLLALQSLTHCPFRVVDEINQGMDPRNERLVHKLMIESACAESNAQYFLVTPKLLQGLKYDSMMTTICIFLSDPTFNVLNRDSSHTIEIALAHARNEFLLDRNESEH